MERSFSIRHVDTLVRSMTNGPIVACVWSLAERSETWVPGNTPRQVVHSIQSCSEELCRLNGQHTSYIFAEGLVAIPPDAEVLIERWVCTSPEEEVRLWSAFDPMVCGRKQREQIAAAASTIVELARVPREVLQGASAGVLFSLHGESLPRPVPPEMLYEAVWKNVAYITFVAALLGSMTDVEVRRNEMARRLCRLAVQGAMYRTWRVDATSANAFWTEVLTGEGDLRHPPRVLREYLLKTAAGGSAAHSAQPADPRFSMLAKCIHAWNNWRKGEPMKQLRVYTTVSPYGRTVVSVPEAI